MNDPAPRGRSPAKLNGKAETLFAQTDCQCDVKRTRNPRCLRTDRYPLQNCLLANMMKKISELWNENTMNR